MFFTKDIKYKDKISDTGPLHVWDMPLPSNKCILILEKDNSHVLLRGELRKHFYITSYDNCQAFISIT